ncbi:MAG: RNA polymerase sigma factor [Candidatus Methylacidiphilales bacterium]|nr:RNA polymerase sigma factor [Candidatus Methylacidiphilales bacterium]
MRPLSTKEQTPGIVLAVESAKDPSSLSFDQLVADYYDGLYRFALSLSQREADAADLVQQTFLRWATKGGQLRDLSKVKTWLFTTLHREFLGSRRRATRFQHHEVESVEHELPVVDSPIARQMDGALVMEALGQVEEVYRAPLGLFYLDDHSYHEIAVILGIPIGTVMSRLSRGKEQLRNILKQKEGAVHRNGMGQPGRPALEQDHG